MGLNDLLELRETVIQAVRSHPKCDVIGTGSMVGSLSMDIEVELDNELININLKHVEDN